MVHTGVDDPFDLPLLEIPEVILRRDDIGHMAAMPERVTRGGHLSFVQMRLPVPSAQEIILVGAPGDAGHEMRLVAPLAPGGQAVFQGTAAGRARIAAHSVHHHRIGPVVQSGTPSLGCLESGFGVVRGGSTAGSQKNQDREKRRNTAHGTIFL